MQYGKSGCNDAGDWGAFGAAAAGTRHDITNNTAGVRGGVINDPSTGDGTANTCVQLPSGAVVTIPRSQ